MLEPKYIHKDVETSKYDFWLSHDYFKSGDLTKEPFTIVIPPPNVTGKLHLGHAWDTTIQDIIIRLRECVVMMLCGFLVWIMLVLQHKPRLIKN